MGPVPGRIPPKGRARRQGRRRSDLNDLLALRAEQGSPDPRRRRLATFNEVIDDWFAAGCPKAAVSRNSRRARTKSENTIATARYLLDGHVRPVIGGLRVDRTRSQESSASGNVQTTTPSQSVQPAASCGNDVRER